ncbi:dihydropteroate synthase [Endozoicomonas montiporae]|uniref:dihydropteroate synthase n=2 Tax=Endozoicomonas montiporae TaxID=1027273 RepID=A0A081N385_9GAMM|nr:dihydropteroate synthase [Endozoicomonas montiporae]AMO58200.1 dihydropteroate synthase [Endozoicomonas montiporae CL-33]KEQ12908.1 dihydropteroate synthase [Endozoicomonas montiporae]
MTKLDCAGRTLDLSRTRIMGILNITPDSFYSGSRYQDMDTILRVADSMVNDGVDIFDVGGESTRPGADGKVVTSEMELERVLPVVEALNARFDKVISVDTSSALVMTEVAKIGAGMINDVRALRREGALQAAARTGLPVVLMHSLVDQPEPGFEPHYHNVADEVCQYLLNRVSDCEAAGIPKDRIILDPGFGGGMFGKTPKQNLSLLKHCDKLAGTGFPVLAGLSRKSFMQVQLGKAADELLSGSLAVALMAVQAGARIIRVHDVAETRDVVTMLEAVQQAE